MGLLEILLLLVGVTIAVISFVIPAKREAQLEETKELAKEEIKELVNQELTHVKEHVEGTVDETITYAVEKTERFMDRMSNEKMMALNEYSDTVMEEIHKTHNEVMFLYDMLNDKHETIKNTVAQVDKTVKAAKAVPVVQAVSVEKSEEISGGRPVVKEEKEKPVVSIREQTEQRIRESLAGKGQPAERKETIASSAVKVIGQPAIEPPVSERSVRAEEKTAEVLRTSEVELGFANLGVANSNEQILRMHKEGKSKVVIAKELGLGVGEVKLVIDLFEGM